MVEMTRANATPHEMTKTPDANITQQPVAETSGGTASLTCKQIISLYESKYLAMTYCIVAQIGLTVSTSCQIRCK